MNGAGDLPDPWDPGTHINVAAAEALTVARHIGRFESTFNATPLVAYRDETVGEVVKRWAESREEIQSTKTVSPCLAAIDGISRPGTKEPWDKGFHAGLDAARFAVQRVVR